MGLKVGLQILQQTGKAASRYTDDFVCLGVRNWTKPTSLKGLHFAPKPIGDSINISSNYSSKMIQRVDLLPNSAISKEVLQFIEQMCAGISSITELALPTFSTHLSKGLNCIKAKLMSLPLDNAVLHAIESSKSSDELAYLIKGMFEKQLKEVLIKTNKVTTMSTLSVSEKQKLISEIKKQDFYWTFNMYKALSLKSTNPRVLEIEKILRQKYGMEFVALNDDLNHAEKLLKACELMHKNGDKLVKNYIVTDMMPATGKCLGTESAVIHSSTKLEKILNPSNMSSPLATINELHTIFHEFGHFLQPGNIDTITIPKHLRSVPSTVSDYANLGGNAELFAELFAKIRLTPAKVTKEELELFEFLKNAV